MSVFVHYRLGPSRVHGVGCFAEQDIPEGALIACASPWDVTLTTQAFEALPEDDQREVRHHGHFDKVDGLWHVDFAMTRFANHSSCPNVRQEYDAQRRYRIVALRDIACGEELLIDYADFEDDSAYRQLVPHVQASGTEPA